MQVARHASLYKNIIPLIIEEELGRDATVFKAMEDALQIGCIREGDLITVVEGRRVTQGGIVQGGAMQHWSLWLQVQRGNLLFKNEMF